MENWRIIEEFPDFDVSDQGRFRNRRTGKIRKLVYTPRPGIYLSREDGGTTTRKVDRVVADAFLPAPPVPEWYYEEPMHLDGNPDNNRATNLRWQHRNGPRRR